MTHICRITHFLFPAGGPSKDLHIPQLQTDLHWHPHHCCQHGHHRDVWDGTSPQQSESAELYEWKINSSISVCAFVFCVGLPSIPLLRFLWKYFTKSSTTRKAEALGNTGLQPLFGWLDLLQHLVSVISVLFLSLSLSTLSSQPSINTTLWKTGKNLLLIIQIAWR